MLKKLLLIVVALIVLLFGIGYLVLPAEYRVERSVVIAAEKEAIYPHVATLATWPEWTAWSRERDPDCEWTFAGPALGAGSVMTWKGEVLGTGEMALTRSSEEGIEYDLAFDEGKYQSTGGFQFEADSEGTRVVWYNEGDLGANPINKAIGLLMDSMLGPDFEAGLEGLKTRVESAPAGLPAGTLDQVEEAVQSATGK